jgi:hypothetical protein
MKILFYLFVCSWAMIGCKAKKNEPVVSSNSGKDAVEVISYFPVTNYIKGQLTEMRTNGINPLEYNIAGSKKDSVWLKHEDLEKAVAPFLNPVIDTLNMASLFKEEKFFDKTINAYTFTYDPISKLPDTIELQHWDVYINPETGKVKRVYMLKKNGPSKQQQLTWEAEEKWCRIINITAKAGNKFVIDNEQKITWNF